MITIDKKLCKGCNICTEFCSREVYEHSKTLEKGVNVPIPKNMGKCKGCNICALLCPDQAIKVDEKKKEK